MMILTLILRSFLVSSQIVSSSLSHKLTKTCIQHKHVVVTTSLFWFAGTLNYGGCQEAPKPPTEKSIPLNSSAFDRNLLLLHHNSLVHDQVFEESLTSRLLILCICSLLLDLLWRRNLHKECNIYPHVHLQLWIL